MINFCDLIGLRNLINVQYFQRSIVFETGLSDSIYLATITEFKTSFQKREPKIIKYRDYKNFHNNKFRSEML